jgi:hypothetical protein
MDPNPMPALREHVLYLLRGGGAHLDFDNSAFTLVPFTSSACVCHFRSFHGPLMAGSSFVIFGISRRSICSDCWEYSESATVEIIFLSRYPHLLFNPSATSSQWK